MRKISMKKRMFGEERKKAGEKECLGDEDKGPGG